MTDSLCRKRKLADSFIPCGHVGTYTLLLSEDQAVDKNKEGHPRSLIPVATYPETSYLVPYTIAVLKNACSFMCIKQMILLTLEKNTMQNNKEL